MARAVRSEVSALDPNQPVFDVRTLESVTGEAFSRQQVVAPRALDVNAIVADAERMLRRVIGEDVDLVTTLQPDLRPGKADPSQLTRRRDRERRGFEAEARNPWKGSEPPAMGCGEQARLRPTRSAREPKA